MMHQDHSFLQFISHLEPGDLVWSENATLHSQTVDGVTARIC